MQKLELWAGVECTKNRVGDRFIDQCVKSGHVDRLRDLEMFRELQVSRLRYPFLWENAQTEISQPFDWTWADERMRSLRQNIITPIVTLLHHGSGPLGTSLVETDFPVQFAAYAKAFAQRFPWVNDYTLINEPLTTARFSCLYGTWYPHLREDQAFVRATLNQVRAIVLAMREIRLINPRAKLIQTEDMGRAQSTQPLRAQCTFENERRWMSFDLLLGRIQPGHLMYQYLRDCGVSFEEINWFQSNACPPDVLGINHYLLSNRFLDHRLDLYPPAFHGGNGFQKYADVGAVDTGQTELPTVGSILQEVWDRYQLPLAVTEVHVRGHREAQMRWLNETWQDAQTLRSRGVDVRAVTAWSLLGTYDWHLLCTKCEGFYESGIYDMRTQEQEPRKTIMVEMLKNLSRDSRFEHPLLDEPGWWRTDRRVLFAPGQKLEPKVPTKSRPILITGGTGTLGRAFARICDLRGISYVLVSRDRMDIADAEIVKNVLNQIRPWAVINTAGYVKVDLAEAESERCYRENVVGAVTLAEACRENKIPYVTFSSDLVFDGTQVAPYAESDSTHPLNVYGRSKVESEEKVQSIHEDSMVIRTSAFFGPWDEYNFITQTLRELAARRKVDAPSDLVVSPTYIPDLVNTTLDLLIDKERGIIHLANRGEVTWSRFAKTAARLARMNSDLIIERPFEDFKFEAVRPMNSTLISERVNILPDLEDALARYFLECNTIQNFETETIRGAYG